jgi:hypothetical protein
MNLIQHITKPEPRGKVSHITGNDTSRRHNTTLWIPTDTRDLVLKWRKSAETKPVTVGVFHLDLKGLLQGGHCKLVGKTKSKIRFNIYREDDRWLRVRDKRDRLHDDSEKIAQLDW